MYQCLPARLSAHLPPPLLGRPAGYFVEPMQWLTTNEATSTVEFKRALHMAGRDKKKRLDTK